MKADRDLSKLHPRLRDGFFALSTRCAEAGHPIFLTEGWRSPKRQTELYAQGRTKPGKIVTHATAEESYHCDTEDGQPCARAFDIAFRVPRGQDIYSGPWEAVGAIAEECGLEWGGRWRRPDRPHFYIEREGS